MIGHKDFPSRSGGVEVMVGGLARSLVERGYDVTVYNRGLEKHHNVYDVDGVHARRVFTLQKPSLNATIYSFLATFDALFRGYDVIHYHAIGPSVPLLIAKLFGKHTVCTVHGLNWKVDKWRGFASRYMKLGERIAAKYADDLVVLSETEWNYFLQKYDRASILIPNAICFYEKRPRSLIRERYGLEQGEYILYVGRISPEKGTMDLVEGYRKAKTGKKLVLVGPLDDSEYCKTVQQQAQNDPNIIMTDYVVGDRRPAEGALQQLQTVCSAQPHRGTFPVSVGGAVYRCTVSGERYPREYGRDRYLRCGLYAGGYGRPCTGAGAGMRTGVPGRNAAAADPVHPYKFRVRGDAGPLRGGLSSCGGRSAEGDALHPEKKESAGRRKSISKERPGNV